MIVFAKIREIFEKIDLNFYFIYLVGLVGFLIPFSRPLMKMLTPAVLFLTALYAMARSCYDIQEKDRRIFFLWAITVFAVTIFMEILGVKYGMFFGQYAYGGVLGPALMGVPLIIGINWLIVIIAAYSLSRKAIDNIFVAALMAGLCAFFFDLVLEPAAITLGFWDWSGSIPIKNYFSWFSITFIFSLVASYLKIEIPGKWVPALFGAQFVFFALIRVFMFFNLFK